MSVVQVFDQTVPRISGYSIRSYSITNALHQLNVPLKILSSPIYDYDSENQLDVIDGVEYHRVLAKEKGLPKYPILKELKIVDLIKKALLKFDPNEVSIIDAHSSLLNGLAGQAIAKKWGKPFIYEIRAFWEDAAVDQGKTREGSVRYRITRNLETRVIRQADHVTVICEGLRQDIIARGIDEKKITVIPNGVDLEKFRPLPKDESLQMELGLGDVRVFGFIGTFFKFEGLDLILKAIPEIVRYDKNVKFLFVGSGEKHQELLQMSKDLDVEKYVIFTGRVPHDQILKYYSVVDIFIYPRISKRITELVTPLKPLEAMACEKVVIGSDVGGIKELVDDHKNGFLFQKGSIKDLALTCCDVLKNYDHMNEFRKDCRKFVEENRNWKTIGKRYVPILNELGVSI
jgi:PEP-CTERM/exosortase A-associated glycosyltransferase